MISIAKEWNPKQAELKNLINKKDKFEDAIKVLLELHSMVHSSELSGTEIITLEDELWDGLKESACRIMPTKEDVTIAWNIWHITRIEDIASNILIANEAQVMNSDWAKRMNVNVYDTGNAMSDDEIIDLSSSINIRELRNYRMAVGKKTRENIGKLKPEELKRKVSPDKLQRVLDEGGVTEDDNSKWLLDFWGKKNVSGLLLMPITRHQVVHLNDSLKLKEKCRRKGFK